ncbi:NAD(P)/FAD-dependent oxidoreductase [Candidatus Woesearchaeota archaeon]|nr:NAD(P)/FAD-dependent oxidoreductase [Candidatus Woesearchaeota archaeon]
MDYDVGIIGAGPAGLFAAYELAGSGLKTIVIDKGKEPCKRNSRLCGVGGAGAFSDGKLNLTPKIGGDASSFKRTDSEIEKRIKKIDSLFTESGLDEGYSGLDIKNIEKLRKISGKHGVEFVAGKQRHIGTDKLPGIMNNIYMKIKNKGIVFRLNTKVLDIKRKGKKFILNSDKGKFIVKYLIAAPGRAGAYWLRKKSEELNVKYNYGPIDVGVRLEFPAGLYENIKNIMYDAKFRLYTKTYNDLVRTFCTNPNGFISVEKYDSFILVNGHASKKSKSKNTNLALLSRVVLTDPVEDTTRYGRAIVRLANTIGGGKPLLQTLNNLKEGRRSTWKRLSDNQVSPTLKNATPGDISMALPERIVINLVEAIEQLDYIIPGINSGSTLVYAPEVKFYDTRYNVTKGMETNVSNFYVAGDASGHSRGIVFSAVTGMIAAEDIKKKSC